MNDVAIVKEGWLHKRGWSELCGAGGAGPGSAGVWDLGWGLYRPSRQGRGRIRECLLCLGLLTGGAPPLLGARPASGVCRPSFSHSMEVTASSWGLLARG